MLKEVKEDLGLFGLLGLFRSMLFLYFETGNKGAKEKGKWRVEIEIIEMLQGVQENVKMGSKYH